MNTENPTKIKKGKRLRHMRREIRGGNWLFLPFGVRVSESDNDQPSFNFSYVGFRLVRNK